MTDEAFEKIVEEGIDALPPWVQQKLENVAFIVGTEPDQRQRQENGLTDGETLFGLYEGVPLSERGVYGVELPDRITIFKKAILDAYVDEAEIRECVRNTIWHEVAHYFGHNEEWVEEEERKRGKLL